ncbi:MAG: hypothetical protein NZT92_22355 [Abditibacteriales bacterium]|nr:hypothetical protein [Abditibacteriales bacterium]MDW8368397.1 hypothetical protein [Abditibacteriales bacterium]
MMLGMLVGLVGLMHIFKKLPPPQMPPTVLWVISALLIESVLCAVMAQRGSARRMIDLLPLPQPDIYAARATLLQYVRSGKGVSVNGFR